MKKLSTIVFLLLGYLGHAQNYSCLQSGVKHYFTNSNGYLRGIRIDSTIVSPDSTIFYPYHTPRGRYQSTGGMLDSTGGSWLGKKVVERADGTFVFDNLWHDSVVIKTQAIVGDSWIFYQDTTPLYYKADLIAKDTMTVLGAVDSVKKILITAYNASGIVATDPVDSFQITLSKNNGFVVVFDLYTFPYHAPDSAYATGLDYYLDNILSSSYHPAKANSVFSIIRLIDPSINELYQWNVGDVYEYSRCTGYFEHYGAVCNPVEYYDIDTITAITSSIGGSSYYFNGLVFTYTTPWPVNPTTFPFGPFVYTPSTSSGVLTSGSPLVIDTARIPEELGNPNLYIYLPSDSSYCILSPLYTKLGYGNGYIVGAEYYNIFENFTGPTTYKFPLGLLSYSNASAGVSGSDVNFQQLIYYNRAGDSCMSLYSPLVNTWINEIERKNQVLLSPNPASTELTVTSTSKINSITITNLLGQTVYAHEFSSEKAVIDITAFPVGLYLVRINGTEVKKFVKD